jgi:putative oxidoreductase
MNAFLSAHAPKVLSILRIIVGFLFLWHGCQKLFNYPPTDHPAEGGLMMFAGVLEFFGGLLILFGLFTRPVAFLLSGLMAVAYFMAHAPGGFLPLVNHGELAVVYCFVFFYLFFAGGGPWSLDSLLKRTPATVSE